jgi:hypothetical protein
MRRTVRIIAFVLCASVLFGCMTGPSYLSRWVDDEHNKNYQTSPLFTGVITDVVPLYPLAKFLVFIPDVLILNPVQFWGFDIWRGEGAPFRHSNPSGGKEPWFK